MGRAKKIKELRRLAKDLPLTTSTTHKHKQVVFGSELIKKGITIVEGKEVNPKIRYHNLIDFTMETNHLKRLKEAYDKGGDPAVQQYCDSVRELAEKRSKEKSN